MQLAPFPTTRRSVVLALTSDDRVARERAFDTLVACYWRPLYKHCRASKGRSREDAEDLVQNFFTRAFEKESLAAYDPQKASFRTFLRLLFDRHGANEHQAAHRVKRGGESMHLDFAAAEAELAATSKSGRDPESDFQQEWTRSVFALAVDRLRERCVAEGKELQFAIFETYDLQEPRPSYRELGALHGIAETQVTNYLAAMRRRMRELVLETIREVTATEEEYRNEVRALLGVSR